MLACEYEMSTSLFPETAPDFTDPLGLLRACHERILQHCELLERLLEHLCAGEADAEARTAAGRIYRYFNTATKLHHQDEEEDLFPHLARQSLKLADRVHRLRQEHQASDELWESLATIFAHPSGLAGLPALADTVEAFVTLQREHVARENEEILDVAELILDREFTRKLGAKMAERRGQPTPA